MTKTDFNAFSENLKSKIRKSYQAQQLSIQIKKRLLRLFQIDELHIHVLSVDQTVSVSGVVANENDKQCIEELIMQSDQVKAVVNNLSVLYNGPF